MKKYQSAAQRNPRKGKAPPLAGERLGEQVAYRGSGALGVMAGCPGRRRGAGCRQPLPLRSLALPARRSGAVDSVFEAAGTPAGDASVVTALATARPAIGGTLAPGAT